MSEEQTVTIDNTEYKVSDLSKDQVRFVNHVADLDRQLAQLGLERDETVVESAPEGN